MDASIIISPANAAFASRAKQLKLLVLDFDGVMTDNTVYVFEDGREAVRCSRLEGYGLRRLAKAGGESVIVSTEANRVVAARARKLAIPCLQDVSDKVAAIATLIAERRLEWHQVGFLGNDTNDLDALSRVGLAVIVADAHECVQGKGFFRTRRQGGDGAVRELCDAVAEVLEGQT